MKALLEFDLSDPSDQIKHNRCIKATDMSIVLFNIMCRLREELSKDKDCNGEEMLGKVMTYIHELYERHNIDINELIE